MGCSVVFRKEDGVGTEPLFFEHRTFVPILDDLTGSPSTRYI